MFKRLILVRHGQTLWNLERRFQGHTDICLSNTGIQQAYLLQKRFAAEKLDAIYSSDLRRAVDTAAIIAEPHQLEVQVCSGLREMNFGIWEGLTYLEIEKSYPVLLQTWLNNPATLEVPGGETFLGVKERALRILTEIIQKHPQGNLLVVTHGGIIAALICGILQKPLEALWNYRHDNSAFTILTRKDEEITLELLNDCTHLLNY